MIVISASVLLLSVWMSATNAGLLYEFNTSLALDSGPDTAALDGANMNFTALIPDGTTYYGTFVGFEAADVSFNQWRIAGSGSSDGTYSDPDGASFAPIIGWFGDQGQYFPILYFTNLAIRQASTGQNVGDHFGPLTSETRPSATTWSTRDSSVYNWRNNASFSVRSDSQVPLPSSLFLLGLGVSGLVIVRKKTCS